MGFIVNLCDKIVLDRGESLDSPQKATKEQIEKLRVFAPFPLPDDYVDFLLNTPDVVLASLIQCDGDCDDRCNGSTLNFYSVERLFEKSEEIEGYRKNQDENILVIGDDIGDLVLLYGIGKEGFGLYYCEESSLGLENYICPSITDMLIHGKGLDTIYYG